jgi:hypothetical protein
MSLEPERTEPLPADMRTFNTPADRETIDRPATDREVTRVATAGLADTGGERAALFESDLLDSFNERWTQVQTSFVDEPRRAVEQADALVSDVIQRIGDSFGRERSQLEQQWDRGDNVSTEDLRQALQRYRSFFSRLLSV